MDPSDRQNTAYQAKQLASFVEQKTKIAVSKLKGDQSQDLYVAVTKATLADEVVPKEKHVRTLKIACSAHAPRQQVEFVIYKLAKRLAGETWLVTLKALMVFHRLMRECDPSLQEQMLKFADRTGRHHMLALDRYADHTTKDTWDYSAWIRVYSMYLDERLDCYRTMKFDPETEGTTPQRAIANQRTGDAAPSTPTASLKDCNTHELLEKLPRVQRLMGRMLACMPEGSAAQHPIVLTSASWVLKESRSIYKIVSEGVMNLADKFFEMERPDAIAGVELYKENLVMGEKLNSYYAAMQANTALRSIITFPQLAPLPADFLTAMEDYVREAPKPVDPNAPQSRRGAGPVAGKISSLAARGGATSSAFASGAKLAGPGDVRASQEASPKAEPEVKAPEVDLLNFEDMGVSEAAAKPQPKGELDFLANGISNGDATGNGAGPANGNSGFGDAPAFGEGGGAQYAPQQTGYAPQHTGYEQNGFEGGYGNPFGMQAPPMGMHSMALVPVGPMGGMPMYPGMGSMGMMGPMGMNPFGPPPAPGSNNPFAPSNPFASSPSPPPTGQLTVNRMADDPLNALTEELLAPKSKAPVGPSPSLNQLRVSSTRALSPQPTGQ